MRFFIAPVPEGQHAEADAFETHDGDWFAPRAVLAAAADGEINVLRPTLRYLERIKDYENVAALLAFADALTEIPTERGTG